MLFHSRDVLCLSNKKLVAMNNKETYTSVYTRIYVHVYAHMCAY